MGNLNSSLILRPVVNGGMMCLSNFHSSFDTFVPRIQASVIGKGEKYDGFHNVDDALFLFDKMLDKYPQPSIVEFTKLLAAVVRMKHCAICRFYV
ncbi:hypothetical protein V6N11_004629 [Hibiscus sabdariffa]|uniref:Pentatricopeptide repeat-containing protein n=1 Tax=Hibiscus sabdariffa TaxID=183260 RepID=A0ABR2SH40_9ROSI